MKKFGSIPVRGVVGRNAIYQVVAMLNNADELHIVMSPEGSIKKVDGWNNGFYYMAKKAKVPIVVTYLDYRKKELGVKGVIYELDDYNEVIQKINQFYKDVKGRNPCNFVLYASK